MALHADGRLTAWGTNRTTAAVPDYATNITAISAGAWHNLALRLDGTILAWGSQYWGETTVPKDAQPAILQQPFSRRLTEGEAAFLHVRASGNLPLTYQWQKDGVDIPRATNSSLAIHHPTARDAGAYLAIVKNSDGATNSRPARVLVSQRNTPIPILLERPQLIRTPEGAALQAGMSGPLFENRMQVMVSTDLAKWHWVESREYTIRDGVLTIHVSAEPPTRFFKVETRPTPDTEFYRELVD